MPGGGGAEVEVGRVAPVCPSLPPSFLCHLSRILAGQPVCGAPAALRQGEAGEARGGRGWGGGVGASQCLREGSQLPKQQNQEWSRRDSAREAKKQQKKSRCSKEMN